MINYFHSERSGIFVCTVSGATVEQFDGSPVKCGVQVPFNLTYIKSMDRDGVGGQSRVQCMHAPKHPNTHPEPSPITPLIPLDLPTE